MEGLEAQSTLEISSLSQRTIAFRVALPRNFLLRNFIGFGIANCVEAKVWSDLYGDVIGVGTEAWRAELSREHGIDWLARVAAIGCAQLETAQTVAVETKYHSPRILQGGDIKLIHSKAALANVKAIRPSSA